MKSGTRPARHLYRVKPFPHRDFGSLSTDSIPDFNLDPNISMPDQNAESAPTACVGYSVADLLTDTHLKPFSPDFQYAAARRVAGDGPGIEGTSFDAGIRSAILFGALPSDQAPISASHQGELGISDWKAWTWQDKAHAHPFIENGLANVIVNKVDNTDGDIFDQILRAMYIKNRAVSAGTMWYPEWESGTISLPSDMNNGSWHNYAFKGKKTIGGKPHLIAKSWQGKGYGDNGYAYFPREVVNAIFKIWGTGALQLTKDFPRLGMVASSVFFRPWLLTEIANIL